MDLPGNAMRHCLILEDATGKEHRIPMEFCMSLRVCLFQCLREVFSSHSLQQLENMLRVLFTPDTDNACIQRRYCEQGQYDLCIDQGTQVIELTSETGEWSPIEAGTKVVMRVIINKNLDRGTLAIKCDACGCSKYSLQSAGFKESHRWMIYW